MTRLVLASNSQARARLLAAAGIQHVRHASTIDEGALKQKLGAQNRSAADIAQALADAKALDVSTQWPDAIIIGADQVLTCNGRLFDKPADRAQANRQLRALSGQTHRLISASAMARAGEIIWQGYDHADLTMRPLSDEFIARYLDAAGDDILHCVGAYQLEGRGIQLFEKIVGDHFTIQGLDLLALIRQLRTMGLVAT